MSKKLGVHEVSKNIEIEDATVGIVVSRWNSMITEAMLAGAISTLKANGVKKDSITIVHCPGSYEIPLTAQWLLETKRYDGIIALGVVIRGGTPHFKYVCNAVNRGVIDLNLRFSTPVTFGILTTDNVQQALDRAGDKGNKGSEAALALLEMIAIRQNIK
ncbi:MAG: 6,7-dimethyl-8-ribityllumazine synthase [Balneola sp.]|nr:6,7-dimethyl-8-ribityllumazine synthase [Balneola sp.]|tara:strand:+ start:155 stop:634 length:480 start_codon:yes stop_codon:yes gene_type:complete